MAALINSNCCLAALDSLGFCSVPSSPWTGTKEVNNCPNARQKTHRGEMTSSWREARSYVFTYLLKLFLSSTSGMPAVAAPVRTTVQLEEGRKEVIASCRWLGWIGGGAHAALEWVGWPRMLQVQPADAAVRAEGPALAPLRS